MSYFIIIYIKENLFFDDILVSILYRLRLIGSYKGYKVAIKIILFLLFYIEYGGIFKPYVE